jgi:hypothetical protein
LWVLSWIILGKPPPVLVVAAAGRLFNKDFGQVGHFNDKLFVGLLTWYACNASPELKPCLKVVAGLLPFPLFMATAKS